MNEQSNAMTLSGSVLEWAVRPIKQKDICAQDNIIFVRTVGATRWEEFLYLSPIPLRDRDEDSVAPFEYRFFCRRSGKRLALLGQTYEISQAIEDDLIRQSFVLRMRRVSISVDPLVKAIVEKPTIYSLSYAYARAPAYGTALKNVIFYGEDLGNAGIFREILHLLTFASCGLRRASGGTQLLKISANGKISFTLRSDTTLVEIEKILGFLRDNGYLKGALLDEDGPKSGENA